MRRRFFWRFGLFLFGLMFLACGAFSLLFWIVALTVGAVSLGEPANLLARALGIAILAAGLAALLLTLRAFRRAAEPIGDVIDAAQRVADGDYRIRVMERGPAEVRGLMHAFNAMTERLQSSDESRRRMLADVSHELRTPLTVIQGNLEGLLDGVYPLDRAHLEPVLDETRQLSHLIQDLSTLALAESGALHLQKETTDIVLLVNETAASFRAQAEAAGIQLVVETGAQAPMVQVDPARIRQVLENLIYNALRYTARGGEIRIICSNPNPEYVTLCVQDTGRGIPPEDLPHVFERFYKTSDSRGTGLGLAIAKSLVLAHGGEIFCQSTVGQGTKIWFQLPVMG